MSDGELRVAGEIPIERACKRSGKWYNMSMKRKYYLYLFFVSMLCIVLFEDSFIFGLKSFLDGYQNLHEYIITSISNFIFPFYFISLPLCLAYFLGWKKGFGLSIITSLIGVLYFYLIMESHPGSENKGYVLLYSIFFACFSFIYLIIFGIVSYFLNKDLKSNNSSSNIVH